MYLFGLKRGADYRLWLLLGQNVECMVVNDVKQRGAEFDWWKPVMLEYYYFKCIPIVSTVP